MKEALESAKELRYWKLKRRKKGGVIGKLKLQVAGEEVAYIYDCLLVVGTLSE